MAIDLKLYIDGTVSITPSSVAITSLRTADRSILKESYGDHTLSRYIGGKIPYFYREPEKIGEDFGAGHDAIEMLLSLFATIPTTPKFQNSHCGEIISSLYLEEVLGYRKLYSKLTLTTAENTNVHKMDAFFVKIDKENEYLLVEAKSSIIPTETTKFSGHRHGILKQMLGSIGEYTKGDERFDFTRIRDNLGKDFSEEEAKKIKKDLIPPGPIKCSFLGVATVNASTIDAKDDDYILSQSCENSFNFAAVVVNDLATLAKDAYDHWRKVGDALKRN